MKYQKYFLFSVFLITFFLSQQAFAFNFNIEPARFELVIKPGKSKNAAITIDNTRSKEPLHVKVYVQDVVYFPDGSNNFLPAGSTPWSCAKWIKISPTEIDIPAGGYKKTKLNVTLPKGAKGGYYAVVFFESGPTLTPGQQAIGVNVRIGALILVTAYKTESYKARIIDLGIEKNKESTTYEMGIIINNESNVLIRPQGSIKTLNEEGKKIKTEEINKILAGILPMTSRKFTVPLENLTSGQYTLRVTIDYGGRDLLIGEIPLKVE